jgi:minimal PKS acyl carrier protein
VSIREVTVEDLKRILRESAGGGEEVDLDGEILDTDFDVLGYDSLALLETAARITREYGVTLDDEAVTSARTPRRFLKFVNGG